jgi:hypothetical protein
MKMPRVGFKDVITELAEKVGIKVADAEVLPRIRKMNLRLEARFRKIFPRNIVRVAEEIARDMVRGKIGRLLRGLLPFVRSRLTTAYPEISGSGRVG